MNLLGKGFIITNLIMGPLLTMSSNHWIMAWCGLEISTLSVIPLIAQQHHPRAIEASTKYFLVQAAASSMVLLSAILNSWNLGQWETTFMNNNISCTLLTISLAMKLGLAPFHLWLPEVLQGSTTMTALLLTTWQKLAPLTLLMTTFQHLNTSMLLLMGLMSTLIGGWGGLNQTQMRKIMAFSSIAHLGWMIIILTLSPKLTLLTFLLYSMMTTSMFLMMNYLQASKMSTMMTSWTKTPLMNTTMMMSLMSLGGLPPLTGFAQKWLILQELTKQHLPLIATLMALASLLSLFFYLRVSYYKTITLPPNSHNYTQQWRHKMHNVKPHLALTSSLSTMLLPLLPMMLSTI
uniref:NADH-ubiquinone oxidoreductase chain 2 n=1 Tax=Platemys platycephala TaxID=44504 RepID=A0A0A6ZDW1_PLAPL|nr:NADH dehydrogenase subunit 2 [Platemys platycephala]AGL45246.1 NADH dehydrogenase subunit 2 [Platemys platycephala]